MNSPIEDKGFLLSKIVSSTDTILVAEYNNANQLIKIRSDRKVYDSIKYDATGKIYSCRFAFNNSAFLKIAWNYDFDTITRIELRPSSSYFGPTRKYSLTNNKVIKVTNGYMYGNTASFLDRDTISCSYMKNNFTKALSPSPVINYYPVDTFAYRELIYNPYLTFGKHVWTLIGENLVTTESLAFGESENLPIVESYATYSVTNTTLNSSGMNIYSTEVIEYLEGNVLLPKVIKRDNTILKFIYIRKH